MRKPKTPKMTEWRSGPPPCVGWWNASLMRNDRTRRWWNGKVWSKAVFPGESDKTAKWQKATPAPATIQARIQWRGLAEKPCA